MLSCWFGHVGHVGSNILCTLGGAESLIKFLPVRKKRQKKIISQKPKTIKKLFRDKISKFYMKPFFLLTSSWLGLGSSRPDRIPELQIEESVEITESIIEEPKSIYGNDMRIVDDPTDKTVKKQKFLSKTLFDSKNKIQAKIFSVKKLFVKTTFR